jgi:hypothetical protein
MAAKKAAPKKKATRKASASKSKKKPLRSTTTRNLGAEVAEFEFAPTALEMRTESLIRAEAPPPAHRRYRVVSIHDDSVNVVVWTWNAARERWEDPQTMTREEARVLINGAL